MSAYFVTATGTDIGKTFVTAGLLRALRAAGKQVDALKPVISGFDPAMPGTSDTGVLLRALGEEITVDTLARLSPWRFRAPLSPDMAAARENRGIDFDALVEFCREHVARAPGTLMIEGVGGVMVPLDGTHTVLDWMVALKLPVLLVAGSYLGTISHTLTVVDVLRSAGLSIHMLIVNDSGDGAVPMEDTVAAFQRFTRLKTIVALPRMPACAADTTAFRELAERL